MSDTNDSPIDMNDDRGVPVEVCCMLCGSTNKLRTSGIRLGTHTKVSVFVTICQACEIELHETHRTIQVSHEIVPNSYMELLNTLN